MQLGFNLSNRVSDTLESSSILIYFRKHMGLYTQNVGRMPQRLNGWVKEDQRVVAGVVKSAVAEEINEQFMIKFYVLMPKHFCISGKNKMV